MTIIGLWILLITSPTPDQPLKGREYLSLNGPWTVKADAKDEGGAEEWFKNRPTDGAEISLPLGANHKPEGSIWYWRETTLPEKWKKQSIRLRFGGLPETLGLWVNGERTIAPVRTTTSAGQRIVTYDITKQVKFTESNLISLHTVAEKSAPILGDVDVMAADEAYIENITSEATAPGWLTVRVFLRNTSDKSGDADLEVMIFDRAKPKAKLSRAIQRIVVSPGLNRAELLVRMRNPKPQPSGDPPSYMLEIQFRQGKDILDNETLPLKN